MKRNKKSCRRARSAGQGDLYRTGFPIALTRLMGLGLTKAIPIALTMGFTPSLSTQLIVRLIPPYKCTKSG